MVQFTGENGQVASAENPSTATISPCQGQRCWSVSGHHWRSCKPSAVVTGFTWVYAGKHRIGSDEAPVCRILRQAQQHGKSDRGDGSRDRPGLIIPEPELFAGH